MVPEKGLEPPRACAHMALNHFFNAQGVVSACKHWIVIARKSSNLHWTAEVYCTIYCTAIERL